MFFYQCFLVVISSLVMAFYAIETLMEMQWLAFHKTVYIVEYTGLCWPIPKQWIEWQFLVWTGEIDHLVTFSVPMIRSRPFRVISNWISKKVGYGEK